MILKTFVFIGISLLFSVVNGQMLHRSTIGSMGNSTKANGISLSQSIGQPSNTATFKNTLTLHQGFQQIMFFQNFFQEKNNKKIHFNLSPNPASKNTNLVISEGKAPYSVVISNIMGKNIIHVETKTLTTNIDCSSFPDGIYLVYIVKNDEIVGFQKLIKKK